MNIVSEALLKCNNVKQLLESTIYQLTELENRMHQYRLSEDDDIDYEYSTLKKQKTVNIAQSLIDELVTDIGNLLNLNTTVYIVLYTPDNYPNLSPGSIIVNNVPYANINDSYVALNFIVDINSVDTNLIQCIDTVK